MGRFLPAFLAHLRKATVTGRLLPRTERGATLLPIDLDEIGPATFHSAAPRPWLQVEPAGAFPAGRWIEMTYSASLYDELVRPVIRFVMPNGIRSEFLPAALFGRGRWMGHVPADATEILISPVERPGCFGFRLDSFTVLPPGWPTLRALMANPRIGGFAVVAACRRLRGTAQAMIDAATRSCRLASYDLWLGRRVRAMEPAGLERPRRDWRAAPHIRMVMHVQADLFGAPLAETLTSLSRQHYPNWSLAVVASNECWSMIADDVVARIDGAVAHVLPDAPARELWAGLSDDILLAPIDAGGTVPTYGLAVLAEYSSVHADRDVFYADEDHVDRRGKRHAPLFKPDWSPAFQDASSYVGRALYLRPAALAAHANVPSSEVRPGGAVPTQALASAQRVGHVRRVLLTTVSDVAPASSDVRRRRPEATDADERPQRPRATVVIPSKDRADLLGACWDSLLRTEPGDFEVVIVDNGSENQETLALYDRMKADPRVRLRYRPGPFNFAELCNAAAEIATAPVLVFLNNDVIVRTPDWLDEMIAWALRPRVGAVGTTLLYPSGRIQHAGVVVGLAGHAAHIERDAAPGQPGYMRRLVADREVSAVTAACLAVEKAKFSSVGGFDEKAFPVELNDIDLCLRLNAEGWATICLAQPILVHHESATRGPTLYMDGAYGEERRRFTDRWSPAMRDDPYFHPALSLHSIATALDQ